MDELEKLYRGRAAVGIISILILITWIIYMILYCSFEYFYRHPMLYSILMLMTFHNIFTARIKKLEENYTSETNDI
ncbi:hypothetical protein DSAG12_02557 [Promethearchaeum syntrophicum]|uniref:Uncharacterized protein n=1 Tax=Promethearchaeum syntrophicum TaxID=2594042 RepID=A0A5B9DCY1_9ARCH|nr:hypothetical protein [Candidatus Prometheoarchaeum syntrophicum]QEE16727.1 hypothetical protein DSAG12_02557 [Candidatus Prometheoarchaeum syntrophicum]